jgi:hypothetical protein
MAASGSPSIIHSARLDQDGLKGVTAECFYRRTVPVFAGFPLKACGNDGFWKAKLDLTPQVRGIKP